MECPSRGEPYCEPTLNVTGVRNGTDPSFSIYKQPPFAEAKRPRSSLSRCSRLLPVTHHVVLLGGDIARPKPSRETDSSIFETSYLVSDFLRFEAVVGVPQVNNLPQHRMPPMAVLCQPACPKTPVLQQQSEP